MMDEVLLKSDLNPWRNTPKTVSDVKVITMNELKDRCEDFYTYIYNGGDPQLYEWGTSFYTLKNAECENAV